MGGGAHDIVVHHRGEDGLQVLLYTHPGIPAYMGMSSAGLCLTWMYIDTGERALGLPTGALIQELLTLSSLADAVDYLQRVPLAAMAFTQLVKPGAPVVFGSFASSMSMRSGAPTFGTPEPVLVRFAVAALARRLGVPVRLGGNPTASKLPDAQAAYESAATFLPTLLAGANFVLHAAGWLEGGLTMGCEKFVLDADMAGMAPALAGGVDLSDNGQAMEAIREVGPGQHFLGAQHTLANFETAFWASDTSDSNSFERWEAEGSKDAATRANERWKQILSDYRPPPLDDAIDHRLIEWMGERMGSFPDAAV